MGQVYAYFNTETKRKLCDDIVNDSDFSLKINIFCNEPAPDYSDLLTYLQLTNPVISYCYAKSIYLIYSPKKKAPFLRSNISGDIISILSADVTRYCILNEICDPYCVEVSIISDTLANATETLIQLISANNFKGKAIGLENLGHANTA